MTKDEREFLEITKKIPHRGFKVMARSIKEYFETLIAGILRLSERILIKCGYYKEETYQNKVCEERKILNEGSKKEYTDKYGIISLVPTIVKEVYNNIDTRELKRGNKIVKFEETSKIEAIYSCEVKEVRIKDFVSNTFHKTLSNVEVKIAFASPKTDSKPNVVSTRSIDIGRLKSIKFRRIMTSYQYLNEEEIKSYDASIRDSMEHDFFDYVMRLDIRDFTFQGDNGNEIQ